MTVLKRRGSWDDKYTREYAVNNTGMVIRDAFQSVSGMLAVNAVLSLFNETSELQRMFPA